MFSKGVVNIFKTEIKISNNPLVKPPLLSSIYLSLQILPFKSNKYTSISRCFFLLGEKERRCYKSARGTLQLLPASKFSLKVKWGGKMASPIEREWSTACILCLNRWKGWMYSLLSRIYTAWMSAVSMFLMSTRTSPLCFRIYYPIISTGWAARSISSHYQLLSRILIWGIKSCSYL